MARREKPIISPTGGTPSGGELPHPLIRTIDFGIGIQRPVVLAHIRSIRKRHPDATPAELVRVLERRYVAAVTTGGAAVGATAVIPGIGTGLTLALSAVETAGFLETTALFAQSVAEVHGIAVADPDRARALIMTMMLGTEGTTLVRQLAGQASGTDAGRSAYWGELVTNAMPKLVVGPLADKLKTMFIRRFTVGAGASIFSKALPFGVGAVIGGAGNRIMSGRVVHASRAAFGAPPERLSLELEPRVRPVVVRESESTMTGRLARAGADAGTGIARVGARAGSAITRVGRVAGSGIRRALPGRSDDEDASLD